jgi:hypothetical protein
VKDCDPNGEDWHSILEEFNSHLEMCKIFFFSVLKDIICSLKYNFQKMALTV